MNKKRQKGGSKTGVYKWLNLSGLSSHRYASRHTIPAWGLHSHGSARLQVLLLMTKNTRHDGIKLVLQAWGWENIFLFRMLQSQEQQTGAQDQREFISHKMNDHL